MLSAVLLFRRVVCYVVFLPCLLLEAAMLLVAMAAVMGNYG